MTASDQLRFEPNRVKIDSAVIDFLVATLTEVSVFDGAPFGEPAGKRIFSDPEILAATFADQK